MKLKDHAYQKILATIGDPPTVAEVILVRGGKRAYLWFGVAPAGSSSAEMVGTLDGAAELRKLAKAILAEVGT